IVGVPILAFVGYLGGNLTNVVGQRVPPQVARLKILALGSPRLFAVNVHSHRSFPSCCAVATTAGVVSVKPTHAPPRAPFSAPPLMASRLCLRSIFPPPHRGDQGDAARAGA